MIASASAKVAARVLLITVSLLAASGAVTAQEAPSSATATEIRALTQALRAKDSKAGYEKLGAFARRHDRDIFGARAALALGYRDSVQGRSKEAAAWFASAERDPVLRQYAVYWGAQAVLAEGRKADALDRLDTFLRDFPDSALTELVLQTLASAAIGAGQPQRALFALEAYAKTAENPGLLLERARAREKDRSTAAAAADYVALFYKFPLSPESRRAGERLGPLRKALRSEFPELTEERQLGRPEAFYEARQWKEARREYEKLAPRWSGTAREKAQLGADKARAQLREGPRPLERLKLTDAALDAERLYSLAEAYRTRKKETPMVRAAEEAAARKPGSDGAVEALFLAGNYFWSHLDRDRAAGYYRRLLEQTARSDAARTAQWRLAWLEYLDHKPDAADRMEEHLERFPGSPYSAEALYWLGRLAERGDNAPLARAYFLKLAERYPQTYFGSLARDRLRAVGASPTAPAPVVSVIPDPSPLPGLDPELPPNAAPYAERARALRDIAFDSYADLELRSGNARTGAARLLLEAAQAAVDEGRYAAAIVLTRQAVPQLEARRWEEIPHEVWSTAFPLPYATAIRKNAARQSVDPMLVAGLIRQESTFEPNAVSRAKAVGLMQILPKTARRLARSMRLPFSRAKLLQPEYNLELGTKYLADLLKTFGNTEAALAAYDAGEDRVPSWQAERKYEETAEFVDSIPFTETREYVQIVKRNAEIYRRLETDPR
jgi:soluble lytic murein transglycosylase